MREYSQAATDKGFARLLSAAAPQPNAIIIIGILVSRNSFGNIAWVTPGELAKETGILLSNVRRALKFLKKIDMIRVVRKNNCGNIQGFRINPEFVAKPRLHKSVGDLKIAWRRQNYECE